MQHIFHIAVALVVSAPLPKTPKDAPPDKDISGDWVLLRLTIGGETLPLDSINIYNRFTGDGKRFQRKSPDDVPTDPQFFTLGRDGKLRTIDIRRKEGDSVAFRGILELDGDTLTTCLTVADPGVERPTKLESPAGSKLVLAVYKRVKSESK
jgi:uncharacterized protein (TIGR03067 family)